MENKYRHGSIYRVFRRDAVKLNIGEIKRYINDGLQPLSTLIGTAEDAASKIGSLHAKLSYLIETASLSGGEHGSMEFPLGETTWTVPDGIDEIYVAIAGGAGGGAGGSGGNLPYNESQSVSGGDGGNGGAGQSCVITYACLKQVKGKTLSVFVGAGGAGGAAGENATDYARITGQGQGTQGGNGGSGTASTIKTDGKIIVQGNGGVGGSYGGVAAKNTSSTTSQPAKGSQGTRQSNPASAGFFQPNAIKLLQTNIEKNTTTQSQSPLTPSAPVQISEYIPGGTGGTGGYGRLRINSSNTQPEPGTAGADGKVVIYW